MKKESTAPDTATLLEFMFRLGQAYMACGEQTAKVELILRRTAAAYGMRKSRVVAFPTAVFVSIHDDGGERVTLAQCEPQTLRLDQIADVYALGEAAQKAEVAPVDGLQRLSAILAQKARFGAAGILVGHTILTVGLAIVLMPTAANLAAAAGLGFIVGAVKLTHRGRPLLAVPLPVIAAALVSILVFLAVRYGLPVDPLHALVPPLITFLPGGMLALGMVELAYGDMVSGASRLIAGFVQLVLLAFGLAVGAMLVGYSPDDLTTSAAHYVKIVEASWIGVLVFAHQLLRSRRALLGLDLELAESRVEMLARGLDARQLALEQAQGDAVEFDAAGCQRLAQHADRRIDDLVGVDPSHVELERLAGEIIGVWTCRFHPGQHPFHVHHLLADEYFHARHLLLQRQVIVGKRPHLVVEVAEVEHRQPGDDHHQCQQGGGDAEDLQADRQSHGTCS